MHFLLEYSYIFIPTTIFRKNESYLTLILLLFKNKYSHLLHPGFLATFENKIYYQTEIVKNISTQPCSSNSSLYPKQFNFIIIRFVACTFLARKLFIFSIVKIFLLFLFNFQGLAYRCSKYSVNDYQHSDYMYFNS